MKRNEEFEAILAELNQPVPELEGTLYRAYKKKRYRNAKRIVCPLSGLAVCFAAFVLLVNLSVTVGNACSRVPVLRQLAEAVTFSHSLSSAVENEYVQIINIKQSQNDITAEIEYLIVDQKQVNIFYRLDSEKYDRLTAEPTISCDDENVAYYVYNQSFGEENGKLLTVSIDFTQGKVPDKLQFKLKVFSVDLSQSVNDDSKYLAEIEFSLEFDPQFTAAGKVFSINKTVILNGQTITVTAIEVYPTHLRVEVAESDANTAWLKNLDFYIETADGMIFNPFTSGVIATGSADSSSMLSYRADSTFFYDAEYLKLVITGAQWLQKDLEKTCLNLTTGEHSELPDGVQFNSIQKQGDDWILKIRVTPGENGEMKRPFGDKIFDAAGNTYTINRYYLTIARANRDGSVQCYYYFLTLKNYPYDEVWLAPPYSHIWTAENPVEIIVE